MILVSLLISLTIVFALGALALSEVLLFGNEELSLAQSAQGLPRTSMIKQDIELTTCPDSGMFIAS